MIMVRMRVLVALVLLLATSLALAAEDPTLSKASTLIKSNDFKSAYELLEPLESERAGDVDYDYLLGVAAVESGKVTRGVFALERVLATNPNHTGARAEIAKAYFKLGETETSKTEFKNVLDQKPPKEVSDAIEKYMSAIDKSLGLTATFAAYLDVGVGHDSNVNSASSASTVAVPFFGGALFTLNSASRERSDTFTNLAGGISFRQPVSRDVSVFASANGYYRKNESEEAFDTSSVDFNAGLRYKRFIDTFTFAVQDSTFGLDDARFRHAYGFTGQWQRDLDDRNQVNLFFQSARLSYPGNSIRDADRYVIGGGWAHVFAGDKSPVLFLSVYGGKEDARHSSADFLGNDLYGVRAGGQLTINPKLVAYGSASYEYRDYNGQDPFFLTTRKDDQYDFALGLRYLPGHQWTIRPQISYVRNDSNIVINDFDRTVVSINFRRDFNW